MWLPKVGNGTIRKPDAVMAGNNSQRRLVAVAIDKDKGSRHALMWAVDNLLSGGQTVILIHVIHKPSNSAHHHHHPPNSPCTSFPFSLSLSLCIFVYLLVYVFGNTGGGRDVNVSLSAHKQQLEKQTEDLFLTFHCFCTRKDISDVPGYVSKGAPDFCTVYVIHKQKISSVKNASRAAPFVSPLYEKIQDQANNNGFTADARPKHSLSIRAADRTPRKPRNLHDDHESFKSPFAGGRGLHGKLHGDISESDTDISFVSSGRPSSDRMSSLLYDSMDSSRASRVSTSSEYSLGPVHLGTKSTEAGFAQEFSSSSLESDKTSSSTHETDDVDAEMRMLKQELKKMMDLYSTACKEALTAQQKTVELHRWQIEEERRLEEARIAEEAAKLAAEQEKAKCRAAIEKAEAAQRIAQMESERRRNAEMKAIKRQNVLNTLSQNDFRYRRYTIDQIEEATEYFSESRKIGEGGYGPVFKCFLDHTPVAVKVLRPDAAQGRSQFQQEVEVLSCMRHPNMVLLLGACPEYGCLIYEYMANGSLEDRLFRRGNTPALSWQLRFRIASEIGTGLLFLHQTKPEPLVHRDLKPGNILLDHNYVSKISDVGLSRLVPPSVADDVTQYRMTSTAGTFCYIDPEYQQTGMLGVKSDVYSLGIMLLQLITAKPAMGLTHHVGRSIEKGTFADEMLDKAVEDWPVDEALCFAKVALQCAELRRKDRPDLGKVVLPELNRLSALGEENMPPSMMVCGNASSGPSPIHSMQDVFSDASLVHSGYSSSKSLSSASSRA
ncbi:hypothetical protein RJ640_008251 [Escallonia rubra]|uniref:RING-type E3 ubiquitin transferase n=1 Tax=Escallonia rubra TaxID=112253 RepID=A0AA88QCE8_9ASTE|nr:hypothetical protein RJ640_008251 [Escallonia rubra]